MGRSMPGSPLKVVSSTTLRIITCHLKDFTKTFYGEKYFLLFCKISIPQYIHFGGINFLVNSSKMMPTILTCLNSWQIIILNLLAGSRWRVHGLGLRSSSLCVGMIGVILRNIPVCLFSLWKIHVLPCEYWKYVYSQETTWIFQRLNKWTGMLLSITPIIATWTEDPRPTPCTRQRLPASTQC